MQEKTIWLNEGLDKMETIRVLGQHGYEFLGVNEVGGDDYQHPDDKDFTLSVHYGKGEGTLRDLDTALHNREAAVKARKEDFIAMDKLVDRLGIKNPEYLFVHTPRTEGVYTGMTNWLNREGFTAWPIDGGVLYTKGSLVVTRTTIDDGLQITLKGAISWYDYFKAKGVTNEIEETKAYHFICASSRTMVGVLSVLLHLLIGIAFVIPVALLYTAAVDLRAKRIANAMAWVGKKHTQWGEWNEKLLTIK